MMLALCPASAVAHPHAWIDIRSTVIMSANGMISAIEQEWLFDDLYSMAVIEDMTADKSKPADVGAFAAEVIENLGPHGYFMRITADRRPVRIGTVTQFKSELKGQRLALSFTAPFAEPVDPKSHAVAFSVFDPSYYIQMSHPSETPPTIKVNGPEQSPCRVQITRPQPSAETLARAFALDRDAAPQDDLGRLFAEQVEIQCK